MLVETLHLMVLKIAAIHHLQLFKFEFLNRHYGPEGQYASACKFHQNWPNAFGDTTIFIFKIAAVCHFYFQNFKFLVDRWVGRPICITVPNSSKLVRWFWMVFKMAAICHL